MNACFLNIYMLIRSYMLKRVCVSLTININACDIPFFTNRLVHRTHVHVFGLYQCRYFQINRCFVSSSKVYTLSGGINAYCISGCIWQALQLSVSPVYIGYVLCACTWIYVDQLGLEMLLVLFSCNDNSVPVYS